MFDKAHPNYVVLEFGEQVTPEVLAAVRNAVDGQTWTPMVALAHAGYDDGLGRIVRTEPKEAA